MSEEYEKINQRTAGNTQACIPSVKVEVIIFYVYFDMANCLAKQYQRAFNMYATSKIMKQ